MLKKDLIEKLKEYGLPTSGVKADLQVRLTEHQKTLNISNDQVDEQHFVIPTQSLSTIATFRNVISNEELSKKSSSEEESSDYDSSEHDSSEEETPEEHEEFLFNPTVLALPVFCTLATTKKRRAMTFFKEGKDGYKLGVFSSYNKEPQISGIANIRDSNMNESKKKYVVEIDKPEKYEPWKRYLIQPTKL